MEFSAVRRPRRKRTNWQAGVLRSMENEVGLWVVLPLDGKFDSRENTAKCRN
jgi:hypothetical protein